MAYGDYIHCCKCDVKLIYDGDRNQREWWQDRFDCEPQIECPDCKLKREWVGLTDDEIYDLEGFYDFMTKEEFFDAIHKVEAKLKDKNL